MILEKDFGKHLRWGNFAFVYASMLTIAKRTGQQIALPEYFAWRYLRHPPLHDNDLKVDEPIFHFRTHQWSREEQDWMYQHFTERLNENVNINLGGNCQSELWFQDELEHIKEMLQFTPNSIADICKKYKHILGNGKKTIGIGVRRGDFVNHGVFYQIPLQWYLDALEEHFPTWRRDYNILIFSDHIEEMKELWKDKRFFFAEPNGTHTHAENFKYYHQDPMEQFILGTLCDNFIIGNSTFSWWQGWYIYNKRGQVIHSGKNLSDKGEQEFGSNQDYYPKSWTLHKINIK